MRKDETWEFVGSLWDDGPRGFYHRECYKAYTLPSALKRIGKLKDAAESCEGEVSGSSIVACSVSTSESTEQRRSQRIRLTTDKELCVICQQPQKTSKQTVVEKSLW